MMGKETAIDVLKQRIAISKASADNDNYDIGLTIREGENILAELAKEPEPTEFTKEALKLIPAKEFLKNIPAQQQNIWAIDIKLLQACDIIDRLTAEIKAIKEGGRK